MLGRAGVIGYTYAHTHTQYNTTEDNNNLYNYK